MASVRTAVNFTLDHRSAVLAGIVAVTLLLGWQLRQFRISGDLRAGLSATDPEVVFLDRLRSQFGEGELMIAVLAVEGPGDIFTKPRLRYLRRFTEAIARLPAVRDVVSLSRAIQFQTVAGRPTLVPFLAQIPNSPEILAAKRTAALANSRWVANLVSADGRKAAINMLLTASSGDTRGRLQAVAAVRRILEANRVAGMQVYLTGLSPLAQDAADYVRRDFKRFLWLAPVLMMLFLWVLFRSVAGVIIPMGIIVATVIWTFGIFFLLGRCLGIATLMLPTLIGVICLSDAVHVMTHFRKSTSRAGSPRATVVATMEQMLPACFLTSLTTAAGFSSLALSELSTIREFGLTAAGGIMIAWGLNMGILPMALQAIPSLQPRRGCRAGRPGLLHGLMERLAEFLEKDRILVILAAVFLTAAAVYGSARLRVETQITGMLPEKAPSIEGMRHLEAGIAGFSTLEMVLTGPRGAFEQPWALDAVDKMQTYAESLPEVGTSFSVVDYLEWLRQGLGEEPGGDAALPQDAGRLARYLTFLEASGQGERLQAMLVPDRSAARLSLRVRSLSTARQLHLIERLEGFARRNLPPQLEVTTGGALKLFARKSSALVQSLVKSLAVSLVVITGLLIAYLRSPRIGLVSMIPNMLPALLTFGLMGLAGIPLDTVTVMIACIALAIAVDDTIHFLVHYQRQTRANFRPAAAVRNTLFISGEAIVATSLVIAGGFGIFLFSAFRPNRYFGILMGVTMLTALVADLLVLPRLLKSSSGRRQYE